MGEGGNDPGHAATRERCREARALAAGSVGSRPLRPCPRLKVDRRRSACGEDLCTEIAQNWSRALASRRQPQAANPLLPITQAVDLPDFHLDDLVLPSASSSSSKAALIKSDLLAVSSLAKSVDNKIIGSSLEEFAEDNGRLGWRVEQEIEALRAEYRDEPGASPVSPLLQRQMSEPVGTLQPFGVPSAAPRGRCGKWMLRARAYCARPAGHSRPCRSKP